MTFYIILYKLSSTSTRWMVSAKTYDTREEAEAITRPYEIANAHERKIIEVTV